MTVVDNGDAKTTSTGGGVFVHPRGLCESDTVGRGTRVWAFAHVMSGAVVGEDCNIGGNAFIEAGARLGDRVTVKNGVLVWDRVTVEDDVFLGPAMIFTNDLMPRADVKRSGDALVPTHVCAGATIGANATIVCGVTIGRRAFVAAGAVVTQDIPAHALVVGSPARRIGWMCTCGQRLDESLRCECGRQFDLTDEHHGLTERLP
jgi:UDP-2-acetamido-3-amino-2,3-dideoxy-glucuronate N-acetyltransferase